MCGAIEIESLLVVFNPFGTRIKRFYWVTLCSGANLLSLNPDLVASVIISIISPIIGTSTTRMRTIYCVIIITIIQLQSYDKYTTSRDR